MTTEEPKREQWVSYGNDAATVFLSELKGSAVIAKIESGVEYRGLLHAIDGFLNIVLHDAKEVYENNEIANLGEIFLRGSVVNYIALA
ncbi:U4/U6-U5 snRNP complex subunit [Starmerella bacillaris]|uniref:U4/U6-U5 snRNP complex subunit n=1 Tax=Starmerella bacillaris TaxID=1247836 RepID=A0AAV5RJW3_STABA|nr:U4/U6-U5 snRNP complex subunit [Starmerella bacillaris]